MEEYRRDKKAVLLKMHVRGARRQSDKPEVPVVGHEGGAP
jgi:hypothetical protein